MIKAILFDLDGTLLPMDNERFLKIYLSRVGACVPGQDAKHIAKCILAASMEVTKRGDGEETNAEMFARIFCGMTKLDRATSFRYFDRFYEEEFPKIGEFFPPEPMVRDIMDTCAQKGFVTALATVPLFPKAAVHARMAWAGIAPEEFALCGSYEDFCTCKPDPAFYLDVAARIGVLPGECLMVGNDAKDDILPALAAGMQAFFLTPYAIGDAPKDVPSGDYAAALSYLRALPDAE